MKNLEFADKLEKFGVRFSSTNIENKIKEVEIEGLFKNEKVYIKNFNCEWAEKQFLNTKSALDAVISKAIDMDSWKHSWHNDIVKENYEKFREIIQNKILERAKDIDFLIDVYFLLNKEISTNTYKNSVKH
jgi:hypothetical protein